MTDTPTWPAIAARLARELGEPMRSPSPLGPPRQSRATWAVQTSDLGELVVKVRHSDRAHEKTEWCAANLPRLGARGYPVPAIVWHGLVEDDWHAVVQRRPPGSRSARSSHACSTRSSPWSSCRRTRASLRPSATSPATKPSSCWTAGITSGATPRAPRRRRRSSLGVTRLAATSLGASHGGTDFANNDFNLSNVLSDGEAITGVIDWDEFGLNSRAVDLIALAFDCERLDDGGASDLLFARVLALVGLKGLGCRVSYRALAHLAALVRRRELGAAEASVAVASRVLDRLEKVAR